jgi:hypothetical protein
MQRLLAAAFALTLIAATWIPPLHAAAPPSGTISCDVVGMLSFRRFIANPPPRKVSIKGTVSESTCDSSGVTGGSMPITGLQLRLFAKLAEGEDCTELTSMPELVRAKVKIKWRGVA